jgi:hypothetical protein
MLTKIPIRRVMRSARSLELPPTFRLVTLREAGDAFAHAAAGADESKPPEWLVFGATIRMAAIGDAELGVQPFATALEDEGFDDVSGEHLIESFARHLMAGIAICREQGFGAIAKSYGERLSPEKAALFDIDENVDLVAWRTGACEPERRFLLDAAADPSPARSCCQKSLWGNPDPAPAGSRLEHRL